mgnify:CR=1 FL=1
MHLLHNFYVYFPPKCETGSVQHLLHCLHSPFIQVLTWFINTIESHSQVAAFDVPNAKTVPCFVTYWTLLASNIRVYDNRKKIVSLIKAFCNVSKAVKDMSNITLYHKNPQWFIAMSQFCCQVLQTLTKYHRFFYWMEIHF